MSQTPPLSPNSSPHPPAASSYLSSLSFSHSLSLSRPPPRRRRRHRRHRAPGRQELLPGHLPLRPSPSSTLSQLLCSPLHSPLTGIDRPVRRGGRARSGGHGQQRRRPGPGIGLLRALARIHSTSPVPRCSRTIRHTSYLSMPRAANPCRKWTQALSSRCTCDGP